MNATRARRLIMAQYDVYRRAPAGAPLFQGVGAAGTRSARRFLRVLIADNLRDTADSMAMLVSLWGHESRVAYDGIAARELACAYQPDVLLLDLAMPGLDGFELVRQLRRETAVKDSLFIALSGYPDEAHRLRCEEVGFNLSFVKPVDPAVVQTLLRTQGDALAAAPVSHAPAAEPAKAAVADPRPCGVLVLDDDDAMRCLLTASLRQDGFVVWPVASGWDALEVYWRNRAGIDVLLLDLRMAGLDGPETLAAIREINPAVRCCFMSGDTGHYTNDAPRAAGVLAKPFQLDVVVATLRRLAPDPRI